MSQLPSYQSSSITPREEILRLQQNLSGHIIGQSKLIERLLIALLADGHLLVEGAPGLAKTKAIKTLSDFIEGDFHRIQFTPDLLPADITGSEIFSSQTAHFVFQKGPIFHNLILADEINRAPAKVQSALLEAMAERQVSVGNTSHHLPELFLVMATQNPIEQEGTYPLPEAQLDRFLMHVTVNYPERTAEHQILGLAREEARSNSNTKKSHPPQKICQHSIFSARQEILNLHMAASVEEYIVQLIMATRFAKENKAYYGNELANLIEYGASPRGTIALDRCARAHAWLHQKDFVSPEDVQAIFHDVLRHRIILKFHAEAEGITPNAVLTKILERVPAV